jgi:hypothetical protein
VPKYRSLDQAAKKMVAAATHQTSDAGGCQGALTGSLDEQ